MNQDTSGVQISEALDSILDELPKFREYLVKDITAAAENGDYNAVTELTGCLKRADILKEEMERFQAEWESIFNTSNIRDNQSRLAATETPSPLLVHPLSVNPSQESTSTVNADGSRIRRSVASKLPHGVKTPNGDFEQPILETLVEMGGAGKTRDVLNSVERKMRHRLNSYDYAAIPSKKNIPRWQESAEWCRNSMVHKSGYLSSKSRWGVWEITDSGRSYLRRLQQKP